MSDQGAPGRSRIPLPSFKLVILVVVVAAVIVFFVQNPEDVEVEFLGFSGAWPVRLIIAVSVVLGIIIDRLGTWFWRRSRARKTTG